VDELSPLRARLAEHVVFVLIEPQHPGNVGAAARAMKNMGLRRLVVVDPAPSFDPERARWMAPGADDVLDATRFVATLDEALVGVHRVVASTARHRRHDQRVHEPPGLAEQILDDEPDRVTAILFGREDFGLSTEHAERAESLLRIATDHHASLNLAQAVLIVAHHLFEAACRRGLLAEGRIVKGSHGSKSTRSLQRRGGNDGLADISHVEPALAEVIGLLDRVGYTKASSPERVAMTLRETLQRTRLTQRQVHGLRGMVRRINRALDNPDMDWKATRREHEARETTDEEP
jgi:TrmH family RNA methyltransferase